MNNNKSQVSKKRRDPFKIVKETLPGIKASLTSFFFRRGGNVYVFNYLKEGVTKHTFIDSGDPRHRSQILAILTENDIDPSNIERIIITHRHVDHTGLADMLAGVSNAKIMAHHGFRSFVEGEMDSHERIWFGDFQANKLKEYDLEYLHQLDDTQSVNIAGVNFPILSKPIVISGEGRLYILGCPDTPLTHSPDQLIIFYSARPDPFQDIFQDSLLPADDIVLSGDLWLMQGPFHHLGIEDIPRLLRFALRSRFLGGRRRNHREQDAAAKEALKRGFSLVRVKPGHGDEFIGSRIIPEGILADRDILLELGYRSDATKTILNEKDMVGKVAAIKEKAYSNFVTEIRHWLEIGYNPDEVCGFLGRIYREQSGGSKLVRNDRKQRRAKLKESLLRLSVDIGQDQRLIQLTKSTLTMLKNH